MFNPKNILVTTTSTVEGIQVKQYLKPVTAHIVAGAGMMSDFFASFTDVFGGRSSSYQKKLTSLYNEAIARLKLAAYELGANCIIGLTIDFDELSGKGKEMFMITAIGTACIIEQSEKKIIQITDSQEKFKNVALDRLQILDSKKNIIAKAAEGILVLSEEVWNFITTNQVHEVFPYILKKFHPFVTNANVGTEEVKAFYKYLLSYIEAFPDQLRTELLYERIASENDDALAFYLCDIVKDLHLLDLNKVEMLFHLIEFQKQKRGLRIITYDKNYYDKEDIQALNSLSDYILSTFTERGTRSTKKQMLSSKEKEIWICECGKSNDMDLNYCQNCVRDIYGFKSNEVTPAKAAINIKNKVGLISELVS